ALRPSFLALLGEIGRFLATARGSASNGEHEQHSLADYLALHGYSRRFRDHFLVPLTSALWSTAPERALEFPAAYAIRFFDQHVLRAFRYTRNHTVLHTDSRLLPRARAARASWNFQLGDCRRPRPEPTITYSLNRLQRLDTELEYCVTLNRGDEIDPERVLAR